MTPDTIAVVKETVSSGWRSRQLLDPEYLYTTKPRGTSILERIWTAFVEWLSELGDPSFNGLSDVIGYIILVGVVVLVVLLIKRSRKQGLFETSGKNLVTTVDEELEPAVDLDRQIGAAVERGDFRTAVRLQYRRTLAELRDHNLIQYRPEKTDADYQREVRDRTFHAAFVESVAVFHRTWYGKEAVLQDQYNSAVTAFSTVRSQIAMAL